MEKIKIKKSHPYWCHACEQWHHVENGALYEQHMEFAFTCPEFDSAMIKDLETW